MSLLFSREVLLDIKLLIRVITHCISCSFQINDQNLSWICSCISSICVNNRMWHELDYQNESTAVSIGENWIIFKFGTPRAQHYCYMCWHCHRTRSSTLQVNSLVQIVHLCICCHCNDTATGSYVCAVHQNILHSIHNPLAKFMHHYSQVTQNVHSLLHLYDTWYN